MRVPENLDAMRASFHNLQNEGVAGRKSVYSSTKKVSKLVSENFGSQKSFSVSLVHILGLVIHCPAWNPQSAIGVGRGREEEPLPRTAVYVLLVTHCAHCSTSAGRSESNTCGQNGKTGLLRYKRIHRLAGSANRPAAICRA